jgi:curved DNA-binding protein CbpA
MDTILYYSIEPLNLFQDINLSEPDRYVLSLIDGNLTVKDILSISSQGNFQTMKILCALISTRMIETKGKGVLEDKSIVEIIKESGTGVDSAFVNKAEDLYMKYQSMDYYSILGIEKWATLNKIRKAYYKAAKEYHPDKHFHLESGTIRKKLSAIFSYITEAYKTLSDPEERKKYDQSLKVTIPDKKSDNLEIARLRFQEGKTAFKRGLYTEAAELFGQAVYLDNSVAAYHFYLGLTYEKLKKLREAEKAISKALKFEPANADYVAELGHIYLEFGFSTRAKTTFEKALRLDPYNKRATSGLQKIKDRS